MTPELTTPLHKKLYRILGSGWYTREELSEKMHMSEHQITCTTTLLRSRGALIASRPSRTKHGFMEYSLTDKRDPLCEQFEARSIQASKDMLIVEMNRIRIEAKELGIDSINKMATRALQATGIPIDPN